MRVTTVARAIFVAITISPATVFAITDDDVNQVLEFNFTNPGARSLSLGGAFTGLADDATAAYANPAGLTILETQEFSFEARYTSNERTYASGGVVLNTIPQTRTALDTSSLEFASDTSDNTALSFASYVIPTEQATYAFYYHRLGDFEARIDAAEIFFQNSATASGSEPNQTQRIFAKNGNLAYQVENFGASAAFKITEDISIGASWIYSDFSISSSNLRDGANGATSRQLQMGEDSTFTYSLGALWRINSTWNLGIAYRHGGSFEYSATNTVLTLPGGATPPQSRILEASFKVPDILSAGLAYRPNDTWLVTLDANKVGYSRTSRGIESTLNVVPSKLGMRDIIEYRLGVEYAVPGSTGIYVRGGAWLDRDHRLSFNGQTPTNCTVPTSFLDCRTAAIFPSGDDEVHYSFGLGWRLGSVQLNMAADFSDFIDTYSISGIVPF